VNGFYATTGASGNLGRRVVELLLESDAGPIIATTRDPAKLAPFAARGVDVRAADFDDTTSLAKAFAGAQRALLISTDALDRPGRRKEQQLRAVKALEAAGAKYVAYTSCTTPESLLASVAPDHAATEAALAATKLDYTALRNNLYAEVLLFAALPNAIKSGQLVDAKGDGKIGWVTREDCAQAAAAVLVSGTGRTAIDISGPDAIDSKQLGKIVADVTGKPITHVSVSPEALLEGMIQHGLPKPLAEIFASFDAAAAKGQLAVVTETVAKLTGRPPQSLRSFLSDARAVLLG
jgi:NAD(P)H dehydrogenase (quinone)